MYKFFKNLSLVFCAIIIFAGCRKKAFDDYYGRPDNLQPPIYQVLQSRGNFTTFLQVIDKSGYKSTLSAAGYWTLFAPNDAAFQKYFSTNNTSIDKIDSVTARKIVTYCLVFNAFQTDHIADFQSSAGWVANNAYKRRTAYYDGFFTGPGPDGASTVLISANRNGSYVSADNNNKYIPYFYSNYMTARGLTAADYNYFFPNSTYSGFNVVNAQVVNKNILAENGVIHEVDQVLTPLPSIEQKLASSDQYSTFRNLFETYMITYPVNTDATHRYYTLTLKPNNVYVKQYAATLAFSPGNENFLKVQDNDGQTDGYTMFAPNNTALDAYLNSVILEFYGAVKNLPPSIIADLLNAHMWQTTVWPSKFASTNSSLNEPARFDPNSNVIDKQFCSNGIFYGTNQVQKANVFSTVYARAYLDPAYSLMTRLFDLYLKAQITSPGLRYTVFMLPDATLRAQGYDYNTTTSQWQQTVNGVTTSGATVLASLFRILQINVVPTPNNELNDLSGDGIAESNGGEYIRWHANTVSSGGTVEKGLTLTVSGSRTYTNGKVYFLNSGLMDAPTKTVAADIAANATTTTSPYYDFYQYLINSTAYSAAAGEINGIQLGANYTVFVPTRAAMQQAVIDGFLPGTVSGSNVTFTYNPSLTTDKDKVARFIYFHILNGITVVPDGKKGTNGTQFPTMLKNSNGDVLNLYMYNQVNNLQIKDNQLRTANVTPPNNASYFPATSNYLGNRVVLHQIDNYLRYNY